MNGSIRYARRLDRDCRRSSPRTAGMRATDLQSNIRSDDSLHQDRLDDVGGFDAGQFHVQALMLEGKPSVVDSQLMEHRRV